MHSPNEKTGVAPSRSTGRQPWSLVGLTIAALVVIGAVLLGIVAILGNPRASDDAVTSREVGDSAFIRDLSVGWTSLPPPPVARVGSASAWTGDELLLWGGYVYTGMSDEEPQADGFSFDSTSSKWEDLRDSPLSARTHPASVWTGRELLAWGGWDGQRDFFGDGAAYDPETDRWRELPPAPITARAPLSVWTGNEFLVWGTRIRVNDPPTDGAIYDPVADSWRPMARSPVAITDASVVWTGREMIVFGAWLDRGNHARSDVAIGAAYDPVQDSWRRLPDSTLSPQASSISWDGRNVIAWDYRNKSAVYSPTKNEWRRLRSVPIPDSECSPVMVSLDTYVFGDYCGTSVAYKAPENRWRDVSHRNLPGSSITLVPAEDAVFVISHDVESDEDRMYAYKGR